MAEVRTLPPRGVAGVVDPVSWEGTPIMAREWLIQNLIPLGEPTMLSGMGGLGKSILALQLAHAAATEDQWLFHKVRPVKTLCVLCEDDEPEVKRRINAININALKEFGDLENMRLVLRDGEPDNSLMHFPGPNEPGTESEFYDQIVREAVSFGAELILLDSLYNFFHGNENNRVQVTQFIYALKRLARKCNAAVLLIAHPSKAGISTGEGYAGATAWHDAVRSRIYLTEEKDEDGYTRLLLKVMKQNYGPKGTAIEVYHAGGVIWAKADTDKRQGFAFEAQAEEAFLRALKSYTSSGRRLSEGKRSSCYAPEVLAQLGEAKGFRPSDLESAMTRLFNQKRIKIGSIVMADRHKALTIVEVSDGEQVEVS